MHYPYAPIVEAIIDIKCDVSPTTTLDDLRSMVANDQYPTVEPLITVTNLLNVSDKGIEGSAQGGQMGHVFRRSDGLRVIQARHDGFAFSCLAPYDRWESFAQEAEGFWHRYREVAEPSRATRLGVRFVNKISAPGDRIEIKDYLRTAVDVSPYLPQMVENFFLQVRVPLPRFRAMVAITSTAMSEEPDITSLILDIDTSQEVSLDLQGGAAGTEIGEGLATLRKAKNYVFEACITDATRRLIE